ncbi:MAG: division/cell wall cluster transcriptional repressor MraZ [Chitinophagaceae bacterium]|jgi:MraZ protein|nr:division/cell wall cluster transcriptional repressor MraZ [Chitinophagaceae bacterium]MBK7678891.1 division/cell wall cluster transcriptional repressor MraZ [Chitinophagaceae bacterium]MBK8299764.1 division/cell wall cluster transcriptional repressor MraZ [Chitinophagaceae bacterium]MBK9463813.1 division/cell wall cluster transcriptional repressor MraZ [Chitinophagaceae bacterium]MBK9659072.1 division/cell wall cluster transcriptional repressor MraZ [Chitinophagaceae bacterium]
MTGFLGEFEATLDAKGRFLLPAGFKKQLPEAETGRYVINRGFEQCLALYPMRTWEPLFAKISGLNEFDPKQREFRRAFLNGATYVEPDTAGRILLPPSLKVYAGLEKDIVLMATGDKIEIWDSNKYKQLFDSISSDALSDLGNQVLGGKQDG